MKPTLKCPNQGCPFNAFSLEGLQVHQQWCKLRRIQRKITKASNTHSSPERHLEIEADFEVDPSHEGSTGFRTVQFGNTSRRHRSGSDLEISLSDNVVRNTQKEKESAEGTIRSLLEKYVSTPNARRTLANRDTDRIIQSSETVENATDVVQALHSAVGENVVTRLVDVIREDPVIATEVIEQTFASIKSKTTPVQIESMESESSQRIDMDRLERHEIIEGDLKLEYYSYDSMKVLQRQMKITNRNDFCVGDPGEEGFETHPIMSNEFQEAFRCIKKEIENHSNESVFLVRTDFNPQVDSIIPADIFR